MSAIGNVFHHGLKSSDRIASRADAMDKTAKIIYRWIDLVDVLTHSVSKPLKLLSSRMKVLGELFEATRFFGVAGILTSQNRDGAYFLQDPRNTWQKKIDRLCLLSHTGLKMINGGYKHGLLNLGPTIPSYKIFGALPAFKFVTDGLIVLSSFFGAWDSILTLTKEKRYLHETVMPKIVKWEYRKIQWAFIQTGNQEEIAEVKEKYAHKLAAHTGELTKKQKELQDIKASLSEEGLQKVSLEKRIKLHKEGPTKLKELTEKVAHLEMVKAKFERRLEQLDRGDYLSVANDLKRKDQEFKKRKWDLMRSNSEIKIHACWLRVATAVVKIAVVSLALTLTAVSLWTTSWLASLLIVGLISDSIGLTKIFYESFAVAESAEEVKHLKKEEQRRKLEELVAMTAARNAAAAVSNAPADTSAAA